MRRTKVTQIYKKTSNQRAVQLLLGHTKLDSTVRYLGVELFISPARGAGSDVCPHPLRRRVSSRRSRSHGFAQQQDPVPELRSGRAVPAVSGATDRTAAVVSLWYLLSASCPFQLAQKPYAGDVNIVEDMSVFTVRGPDPASADPDPQLLDACAIDAVPKVLLSPVVFRTNGQSLDHGPIEVMDNPMLKQPLVLKQVGFQLWGADTIPIPVLKLHVMDQFM